jgi:dTDP-4-amino-4,6-dideoxygalactose transaminase
LKKKGIETLIHYPIPIPLEKAYEELGYRKGDFPLTAQWSRKILSLPFFPEIKEYEMEEVAEGIRSFNRNG